MTHLHAFTSAIFFDKPLHIILWQNLLFIKCFFHIFIGASFRLQCASGGTQICFEANGIFLIFPKKTSF